jgi:predicted ATP-binding protein involved in virulence
LPIIAYYGAGRAWLPSNQREPKAKINEEISRRWDAFYDCFEERIRIAELHSWFQKEALASLNNQGQMRSSYEVVKHAILGCIPDSKNLWFDPQRAEIVIEISGNSQPFSNLSAGQKMMVALISDIAIKIVTQNTAFLPQESTLNRQQLPEILAKTTGLVLIDELDVHLHPKWQRRIVNDLKNTFPSIQFVCTTHSPVILSEVEAKCIRFLEKEEENIEIFTPSDAFGLDVNRILNELMGVSERNQEINDQIHDMFQLIDDEEFDLAREKMILLIEKIGESDPNITRAKSLIKFLEGDS